MQLEQLLLNRVMTPIPRESFVVPQSLALTHFGHLDTARVVTVGINPSVREFCDARKPAGLLAPEKKRVVDRQTLGIRDDAVPTIDEALRVVASYNAYFDHSTHYSWFDVMQVWALAPLGVSYVEGSAAHLDLVQWATNPVWSKIPSKGVREHLVESDTRFLGEQIRLSRPELVLFNGATVVKEMRRFGHFAVQETGAIPGSRGFTFYLGTCGDARAIGWSLNIQAQQDKDHVSKEALRNWLRTVR